MVNIIGNKISIEQFNTLFEVEEYLTLYNDLNNRSLHDHTDISSGEFLKKRFEENRLKSESSAIYRILNSENELVGIISYSKVEYYDYVLGYRILEPIYKRKGYMSEALNLFIDYMFDTFPKLRRLTLKIASENTESIGLALKVGFKHEGTLRDAYEYRNHVCDFEIYGILKNEKPSTK